MKFKLRYKVFTDIRYPTSEFWTASDQICEFKNGPRDICLIAIIPLTTGLGLFYMTEDTGDT